MMVTRKNKQLKSSSTKRLKKTERKSLPDELEVRLQNLWSKLGDLIDWCDDSESWIKLFCAEARPYRETFYWEAVAEMVSNYILEHPMTAAQRALTDCLIATQSSPSTGDSNMMTHFREAWQQLLGRSREKIENFIKSDLELAKQEETYETVAALYAADYHRWIKGKNASSN